MMAKNMIEVEGVSKRYRLGTVGADSFLQDIRSAAGKLIKPQSTSDDGWFWALKDVSFNVKQGDVVGIVGKNGAGKSTLLKVLSRITSPSRGQIRVAGRIASLLEVGTGFHPDLTGRENIFLNGAILGMSRKEVAHKFDEIVAFSGVGQFIDTPVKRYSSGMYVRLAFAVAAHLEPEILVVDEVLAVGDSDFQRKCIGKMQDISRQEGRTILFVSHNMAAVRSLCNAGVFMRKGEVVLSGSIDEAIDAYARENAVMMEFGAIPEGATRHQFHPGKMLIHKIQAFNQQGIAMDEFGLHEPIRFEIDLHVMHNISDGIFCLMIVNSHGEEVLYSSSRNFKQNSLLNLTPGHYRVRYNLPQNLMPGSYRVNLSMLDSDGYPYESLQNIGNLVIHRSGGSGEYYPWHQSFGYALVHPDFDFQPLSQQ
jgi:lipopolysaccharide transport system ATP-binding protein